MFKANTSYLARKTSCCVILHILVTIIVYRFYRISNTARHSKILIALIIWPHKRMFAKLNI